MEGLLDVRDSGAPKSDKQWIRLAGGELLRFSAESRGRGEPARRYALRDVKNVSTDDRRCLLEFNDFTLQFRAADAREAGKWFAAIQAHTMLETSTQSAASSANPAPGDEVTNCFWVQCEALSSLPPQSAPGSYFVRARWLGSERTQESGERPAVSKSSGDECVIRQQILLQCEPGQDIIHFSVMRVPDFGEPELVALCEVDSRDKANQAPRVHELRDKTGGRTAATARLKLKPGTRPPEEASAPAGGKQGKSSASGTDPANAKSPEFRRSSVAGAAAAASVEYAAPTNPAAPAAARRVVTPPPAQASRAARGPTASAVVAPFDPQAVRRLLDDILTLISNHGLRTSDLFRHPHYNPQYAATRSEDLDAEAILGILRRAGGKSIDVELDSVRMLVRAIDTDGGGTVSIDELDKGLRDRKRGKIDYEEVAAQKQKRVLSERRKQGAGGNATSPEAVLDALSAFLDTTRIRVADIFRHPQYNPSYLETGDEELDADELMCVAERIGLEINPEGIVQLIECLDCDGTASIGIVELESALRAHRRGIHVWETEEFKRARDNSRRATRTKEEQDISLNRLFKQHQTRMERFEVQRAAQEREEDRQIEEAKQNARLGTRAMLNPTEAKPAETCERLYKLQKEKGQKLVELQKKVLAEERDKIESTRTPRHRSLSRPRPCSRAPDDRPVVERLYNGHAEKMERLKGQLHAQAAKEIQELDTVGDNARKKVVTPRGVVDVRQPKQAKETSSVEDPESHERLYNEHKLRRVRLDEQRRRQENLEASQLAKEQVGSQGHAMQMQRIKELVEHHTSLLEWRSKQLKYNEEVQVKKLEEKGREARSICQRSLSMPGKLRNVEPRFQQIPQRFESQRPKEAGDRPSSPSRKEALGFGSSVRRPLRYRASVVEGESKATNVHHSMLDSVDHIVATVNSIVALRSGCSPEDAHQEFLRELREPMSAALQEFKGAAQDSDMCEATTYLYSLPSQRTYFDGRLLEDPVGFQKCCEPDKVCQIAECFEDLYQVAQEAHWRLLARIGPKELPNEVDMQDLARRWPAASRWNRPKACRLALFAYNPGVKSLEAARVKSFVRYAPSDPEMRFRHLLDLARVSLVFADTTLLRGGLQQILQDFEVVAVRNYYAQNYQGLIGDRYIELSVIIKDDLQVPHICEIRLEEMTYYTARLKVMQEVGRMGEAFSAMYQNRVTQSDPAAIAYLVKHTLFKPKPGHLFTVFRRHLARRFGSAAVAWRRAFGNEAVVSFNRFRDVCGSMEWREHTVEFWQGVDCGYAGQVSLFDLDPEAVVLLSRLYARLMGLVVSDDDASVDVLFGKLTARTLLRHVKPDRLEQHELRTVLKPLGFTSQQADKLFSYLDSHGGSGQRPPATITMHDIGWLTKLPDLVNVDAVMLLPEDAASHVEYSRLLIERGHTQGRRSRAPSAATGSGPPPRRRSSMFLASAAGAAITAADLQQPRLSILGSSAWDAAASLRTPPASARRGSSSAPSLRRMSAGTTTTSSPRRAPSLSNLGTSGGLASRAPPHGGGLSPSDSGESGAERDAAEYPRAPTSPASSAAGSGGIDRARHRTRATVGGGGSGGIDRARPRTRATVGGGGGGKRAEPRAASATPPWQGDSRDASPSSSPARSGERPGASPRSRAAGGGGGKRAEAWAASPASSPKANSARGDLWPEHDSAAEDSEAHAGTDADAGSSPLKARTVAMTSTSVDSAEDSDEDDDPAYEELDVW